MNHVSTTIQDHVNQVRQLFGLTKNKVNKGCAAAYIIASAHLLQLTNVMDDIMDEHGIGMDIITSTAKKQIDNIRLMVRRSQL